MRTLRGRILLVSLASLGLLSSFLSAWGLNAWRRQLDEEFHLRALVLVRAFAHVASQDLERGRVQAVKDLLDSLLADPDVEEARLLDGRGRPLAAKVREGAGADFQPEAAEAARALGSFTPVFGRLAGASQAVYQRVWSEGPGGFETKGLCVLRLSRYRLDRQVRRAAAGFLAEAAAATLLLALISYWLSLRVVRPIEQLRRAADALARGDFSAPLPSRGRDEIGALAVSFELMSREVRATRRALEERVRELEASRDAARQAEDRLRQAQKMEAVGRLAGGVAHDFNNLLTAILGYASLLMAKAKPGDPDRDDLRQIVEAGQRASGLTRQLLAFSRKQVLETRVLSLNTIASSLEKMLRRLIGEHIELRTALASGLGPVKADAGQLEQVLLNLAVNARDAMPQGGTLTISTRSVTLDAERAGAHDTVPPGVYAALSVKDTGGGIPPEIQGRVFEPFFTTKAPGHGTGLGLATVFGIVKQSGGYIEVASAPGRGTEFTVYLPLSLEAPEASVVRTLVEGPLRGNETILLAEDELAVRALMSRVLREAGYAVVEAGDGEEALAAAQRHEGALQLLLTDLVMPKVGGRELAARLSALRPDLKVILISGYTDDPIAKGELAPGVLFLNKPISPEELLRQVRRILDRR